MTKLSWGASGERIYETGVDQGVLYVDNVGYAWTGLSSVQEKSSGGEPQPYYVDGFKFVQIASATDFEATIEAYSSPKEFGPCDGSVELYSGLTLTQQKRKQFNLSYRTLVGNDVAGLSLGYKIHLVYNALAAPSEKNNASLQQSADPVTLSWSVSTNPPTITGSRPTAHFIVDSRRASPTALTNLETILYGSNSTSARSPSVAELVALFV